MAGLSYFRIFFGVIGSDDSHKEPLKVVVFELSSVVGDRLIFCHREDRFSGIGGYHGDLRVSLQEAGDSPLGDLSGADDDDVSLLNIKYEI